MKSSWNKGKFWSKKTKEKMSKVKLGKHLSITTEFKKGHIPYNKGKKLHYDVWNKSKKLKPLSSLMKEKLSEIAKEKRFGFWNKGRKLSKEHREKLKEINLRNKIVPPRCIGDGCHFWRGGRMKDYPEKRRIRVSSEIRQWKKEVFERDDYTCKWCKQRGGKLVADHIKMFAFYPELRLEISNGQTLCENCNKWKTMMDMKIYCSNNLPELNIV